jgi:hypothetical protein
MKLKLYFSALRRSDQELGKLFRRHGRIDVHDHLPFRREQVKIGGQVKLGELVKLGGMSDFHPMEFQPPASARMRPSHGTRPARLHDRRRFRSPGKGIPLRKPEASAGHHRGSLIFPCRDQGVPGYVTLTHPELWHRVQRLRSSRTAKDLYQEQR